MRLRTIGLIATLALGLFAGPLPAEAQQSKKIPKVGFLSTTSGRNIKPLRESLRELGYIDGKNITIVTRMRIGDLNDCPNSRQSWSI